MVLTRLMCLPLQDYPSISQLATKIAEKKVNVIFAITEKQKGLYEQLTHFIEGSSVGVLEGDSSNVVTLIRQNYEVLFLMANYVTSHRHSSKLLWKVLFHKSKLFIH